MNFHPRKRERLLLKYNHKMLKVCYRQGPGFSKGGLLYLGVNTVLNYHLVKFFSNTNNELNLKSR